MFSASLYCCSLGKSLKEQKARNYYKLNGIVRVQFITCGVLNLVHTALAIIQMINIVC